MGDINRFISGGPTVRERLQRALPRLLLLTAPPGYGKTMTALAYANAFKTHALIDLQRTQNTRALLLSLLRTLASFSADAPYLRQAQLSLAVDEEVPAELAERVLDAWRDPGAPAAVVFDGAEHLLPQMLPLFNEILERRPSYRTCIVCSDVPLALRVASIASPGETMHLGAADLALSEEEARAVFADTDIPAGIVRRLVDCAQGHPLTARLLRRLCSVGHPENVLAQAEQRTDPHARYRFIQDQVLESLSGEQRRVIEFLACVRDVGEDELRTCLGAESMNAFRAVASTLPLIQVNADRINVHPLVREAVARTNEHALEDVRNAAHAALRRGDPDTAAERYLSCGDRRGAEKVLDDMLERGATAAVADLAARLDRDILARHPRWFALTALLRRYDVPPAQNLAKIQAFSARVQQTGDAMSRLSIGAIEAHQLLHCGSLERAQERLGQLDFIVTELKRGGVLNAVRAHVASRFVDTLRAAYALAVGKTEYGERFLKRARFMLGHFPLMSLSVAADGWLPIGLIRADLHVIRSYCARARESLTRNGLDIVLLDLDTNEAFAAWVLGDDAVSRELLQEVDVRARSYRSRAYDHVLGCAGLRPQCEATGLEPLRRLIIAHILAAARMKDEEGLVHAQHALRNARELRHAVFVALAATAVRERGGDPGSDEYLALAPQTVDAFVSRMR